MPGEVVVKLQAELGVAALSGLLAAAEELFQPGNGLRSLKERPAALPAPFLMKLELRSGLEPAVVCEFLSRLPMVEMAKPNYIFRNQTTPDDTNDACRWTLRRVGRQPGLGRRGRLRRFYHSRHRHRGRLQRPGIHFPLVPGYDYYNKDPDP